MPPDALQPKDNGTNPGPYSFLFAPPGVSTRDPSSERRNYLARNGRLICLKMPDFQVTFRDLLHAVNLRHGTDGFTSLPKEDMLRIFLALKNPTASAGFEPANLGNKGQHATARPSKPLTLRALVACIGRALPSSCYSSSSGQFRYKMPHHYWISS